MNVLWAWQCGFLRRRLEYKYGLLRLELHFPLWYKGFQKTEQIGQVATWAVLFASLCFCQTRISHQRIRCRFSHLHKHMDRGRRGKEKTLGEYFSLWNLFIFLFYFLPALLGTVARSHVCSLSSLSEISWSHTSWSHRVCGSVLPPVGALVLWTEGRKIRGSAVALKIDTVFALSE